MSDSKQNDSLPPSIGEALKHIHEPPETPREDMWHQIQAQRQESKIVRGHFAISRPLRIVAAAAAILLVGFLMGRLWEDMQPSAPQSQHTLATPADKESEAVSPVEVATSDEPDHAPGNEPATDKTMAAALLSQAQLLHAANHFSRSGLLLAQFAETAEDEEPLDPALHQWARDLLANTRLLLDSPLGADPQYRKLLRELEFTLAQIVQASTAEEKEERKWVAGQVSDRSLVQRLRLIVPALPGSRDI